MNPEYWLNRWLENRIGFHLNEVNPILERFLPEVSTAPERVLLPLCGKSVDLHWLADRGYTVVGVDLSPIAARAALREPRVSTEEPPFAVLRTDRISFYIGDFFLFTTAQAGLFNLIYDRAALIALATGQRPAYAKRLRTLMDTGARMLLIALEYDQGAMEGPPYAVLESEIRTLFAGMTVDKLCEYDCLETEPRFKERGLTWMKETVYRIAASGGGL